MTQEKCRALVLAISTLLCCAVGTVNATEAEKVRVALNWNAPNAAFVHYYAAEKHGFYRAEGLEVELLALPGSVPAVTSVGTGDPQIGQAGGDAILLGVSRGIPLKIVWLLYQSNPTGVIVPKASGIRSFADLRGKTISTAVASPEAILLRARLRQTGIDPDREVTFLNVSPGAKLTMMLSGRADVATGFMNFQFVQARMKGRDVDFLPFSTKERPLYGHAIFANERYLAEHPDRIRRFLKATVQGLLWARGHVDQAVEMIVDWDRSLELDREFVKRDLEIQINSLISSDRTAKRVVGHMERDGWAHLIELLADGGVLDRPIDLDSVFTNDFIPDNAKEWYREEKVSP